MATNNSWNNSVTAANVTFTGGTMSIGTDSTDNAINIGTAANTGRTTTVGNTTAASVLALKLGTGDFTLASATGTIISALDTGEMIKPLQPAFLAFLPSSVTNATGGVAAYQLGTTTTALTEVFDQNSDFNTNGTFTAPITARYHLFSNITYVCNNTNGGTEGYTILRTSNRDYYSTFTPTRRRVGSYFGPSGNLDFLVSTLGDMDAADTAIVFMVADGGSDTDTILGDSTILYSHFSGFLAV